MLPLKSTKRRLIMTAIVALVMVGAYIYLFSSITSTNKALAELDYKLEEEVHTESQLRDVNNVLTETMTDREILDSYFISRDGVVDFINNLEDTARSVGVTTDITSVDIQDFNIPWAADNFELLSLDISVKGNWQRVFHFLSLIDNLPYYKVVNRVSMESIPLQADETVLSSEWIGIFSIDVVKKK